MDHKGWKNGRDIHLEVRSNNPVLMLESTKRQETFNMINTNKQILAYVTYMMIINQKESSK